jgi:large subunit ribosomal protein L24
MKFGSHLSKDLRSKYGKRSIRPRVGDTVKIMRGEFRGIEGKITKVIPKEGKINVEGVTREKAKGGTVPIKIDSSKVMIISLNTEDKLRMKKLEAKE